jgi:hypothetical protein
MKGLTNPLSMGANLKDPQHQPLGRIDKKTYDVLTLAV